MTDARMYPDRPYLAVSAAIIRDGHVLVARRNLVLALQGLQSAMVGGGAELGQL